MPETEGKIWKPYTGPAAELLIWSRLRYEMIDPESNVLLIDTIVKYSHSCHMRSQMSHEVTIVI